MTGPVEELRFQAQTKQLLDLMIHSIYSDKDTFLRELISNASDALDKLRLAAFGDKDLKVDTSDLHITLETDAEARTLTVRDNGVGMSRDEVVDLIGTLARSGTGELRAALAEAQDAASPEALIGQFGIGFYSAFMVADEVTLVTRKAGETEATRWRSDGGDTYTIETLESAPQGTAVTLHLKPVDVENHLLDYTDTAVLEQIVRRYSDFISWPIRTVRTVPAPPPAEGEEPGSPTEETVTLNTAKALWTRPRAEVTDEEYTEFYRHVAKAWDTPLEVIPFAAEGTFEYKALLFLPSQPPMQMFQTERRHGVALYVKRVFIMDECPELMPEYLRFVSGVVDAEDLSLNVSREVLQQDRRLAAIRRRLVRRVLSVLAGLRDDRPEDYRTFWAGFGAVLKEGLISDADNREAILDLLLAASTGRPADTDTDAAATDTAAADTEAGDDAAADLTTLAEYVGRMGEEQEAIYYLAGSSRAQVEASPHMEAFRARGIEVLVLTDPVDEVWVEHVGTYRDLPLRSIAKGAVDLDPQDETADAETDERFAGLLGRLTELLADKTKDVRLSHRLTESAACVVGDDYDITPALERMLRASGQEVPPVKRILELNPAHRLTAAMEQMFTEDPQSGQLAETAELVYTLAVIAEGGEPEDPAGFARTLADRLAGGGA